MDGLNLGITCSVASNCPDLLGCPGDRCPDFTIKRHDTKPAFKVSVEDCDGALDLQDDIDSLVLEVNMWANAKLKTAITAEDAYFGFADAVGFEQVMQGDVIVMDRARLPEHMLVDGFDETNKLIHVQRGYNGTTAQAWKKGQKLKVFRVMNDTGSIEFDLEDILQIDGTTLEDQLTATYFMYDWTANSTCLAGCYWLEYKLIKMESGISMAITDAITPSFTPSSYTADDFHCSLGLGVEWVRRFPVNGAFLIHIADSPTSEI